MFLWLKNSVYDGSYILARAEEQGIWLIFDHVIFDIKR